MYYAPPVDRRSRFVGLAIVGALHLALIIAAINFVRTNSEANVPDVLTTEIIQDVPPPTDEPPPPPPPDINIDLAPMPDTVLLPEIVFDAPQTTAIQQVTRAETVPEVRPPPVQVPVEAPPAAAPGIVTQPSLPRRITKPEYPRRARQLNEEGITTMRVCIDARGRVSDATVTESSGYPRLDEASLVWARNLRGFTPKKIDGKEVDGGCVILPLEWVIE